MIKIQLLYVWLQSSDKQKVHDHINNEENKKYATEQKCRKFAVQTKTFSPSIIVYDLTGGFHHKTATSNANFFFFFMCVLGPKNCGPKKSCSSVAYFDMANNHLSFVVALSYLKILNMTHRQKCGYTCVCARTRCACFRDHSRLRIVM